MESFNKSIGVMISQISAFGNKKKLSKSLNKI